MALTQDVSQAKTLGEHLGHRHVINRGTEPHCFGPNLAADRARSFSDSTWRLRGSAVVTNDRITALADAVTSSTARSNASSLALDGLVNPQIFLTN
jgi:hypothetical protein